MTPLDPFTDIARRAWLPCPNCHHGRDCLDCQQQRTCGQHWQYLLANTACMVHLQCPTCAYLWDYHLGYAA